MMMTKYILHIILITILIGTSSCSKFFDQELHQSIDSDDAILNLDDAQVALTGCYNGLQHVELYARDLMIIADLAADNSKMNTTNTGRFVNIYQWNIHQDDKYLTGIWDFAYNTIYLTNKLITDVSKFTNVDEAERSRILGEAKVIRSLLYFKLVNFFGQDHNYIGGSGFTHYGVPYITEPIGIEDDPGRNLVSDVYSGIIADLEGTATVSGAINLLSTGSSPFYINVAAAKALLSRVYLYMGSSNNSNNRNVYLAKARNFAEEVINDGNHNLVPQSRFINAWSLLSEEENEELIFTVRFLGNEYWGYDMLAAMYMEEGYGDILVCDSLYSIYEEGDIRKQWFRESDGLNYIEKYPGKRAGTGDMSLVDVNLNNQPIFRLAEMYLNAAEAEALLGNNSEAQVHVNAITQRAGASLITETGAKLLESIKEERRKELCFEGHRLWDIKRWHDDLVRGDLTNPNVRSTIEYPSYLFAYPIPESEIEANSTIRNQQNPGY